MSTKYETYHLLSDALERMVSKKVWPEMGVKPKKGTRSHKATIGWLFAENLDLLNAMDAVIMAEEFNWLYRTDRHVIFPQDGTVLDKLLDAKVSLENPAAVDMPHKSFVLAIPRGYSHGGVLVPSVMVTFIDYKERDRCIAQFGMDTVGYPIKRKRDNRYPDDNIALMINYRMIDKTNPSLSGVPSAFRACVPVSLFPDILRCNSGPEFREVLGSFETYKDELTLNDEDATTQFKVVKLVLMLGMYQNSFPGCLHDGYPTATMPKKMEPLLHKPWSKQHLTMPSSSSHEDNKQYHYRSWHFRQLMDERYYRGEHAHKPIGSRVVFVRDSMVGREIDAETLT